MSTKTAARQLQDAGFSSTLGEAYAALYPSIIARNRPRAMSEIQYTDWKGLAEASMRARQFFYWHKHPGDCGTPYAPGTGTATTGIRIGTAGLSTATATTGLFSATAAASATLGAVTAGVGLAVLPILAIFQHHAKEVARTEEIYCNVSLTVNGLLADLDAGVKSGKYSPQDAVAALKSSFPQLKAALQGARGKEACNAECFYEGVLDCLLDESEQLYPFWSPSILSGGIAGASLSKLTGKLESLTGTSKPLLAYGIAAGVIFLLIMAVTFFSRRV